MSGRVSLTRPKTKPTSHGVQRKAYLVWAVWRMRGALCVPRVLSLEPQFFGARLVELWIGPRNARLRRTCSKCPLSSPRSRTRGRSGKPESRAIDYLEGKKNGGLLKKGHIGRVIRHTLAELLSKLGHKNLFPWPSTQLLITLITH